MRSKSEYALPFEGLKLGVHEYEFKLDNTFFASEAHSFVQQGELHLKFKLEKKERMMLGNFDFDGYVISPCDLCTEDVKVPLKGVFDIVFKFGDEESNDENLIMIASNEFEINISPLCIEFIASMMPLRVLHPDGECNEEMLELLDKYSSGSDESDDDEADPRWEALKKLN
jgi:uncharacterized metal-binding protein YceD (DUF177 family)